MHRFKIIILFLIVSILSCAQVKDKFGIDEDINDVEININSRVVSSYLYRGQNYGGLSFQPSVDLKISSFYLINWFNIGTKDYMFSKFNPEYDLVVCYNNHGVLFGGKYVSMFDYENQFNAFIAINPLYYCTTNQSLLIKYDIKLCGNDINPHLYKRAYTSYIVAKYKYYFDNGIEIMGEIGCTPYAGSYNEYKNKFSIINVGFEFKYVVDYDYYKIEPFFKLSVNPYKIDRYNCLPGMDNTYDNQRLNFAVGCDIKINVLKR